MNRRTATIVAAALAVAAAVVWTAGRGWYGTPVRGGLPQAKAVPREAVEARDDRVAGAASGLGGEGEGQILFGDLHVHTSFSLDAFQLAMPLSGGSGVYPVSDACDFARYCADLDFWSINDHANSITPRKWSETIAAIRACNERSADRATPDLVSFLGWEWTQMGSHPGNHFGHKNVILRDTAAGATPTRPISALPPEGVPSSFNAGRGGAFALGLGAFMLGRGHDLAAFMTELADVPACPTDTPVRDLPDDCHEGVETPAELFARLDEWGLPALVIPHGTTWGMYTPPGSAWDKQLAGRQHDPERQRLVEVYSGHGNSEEYRSWRAVVQDAAGARRCPPPSIDHLPACWRAGEIIAERCRSERLPNDECERRAADARQKFVDADRNAGPWTVPGVLPPEWRDAGQCRDCFLPAFNYRPLGSVQSMLALSHPQPDGNDRRFRFGFVAASDIHTARPGTGYKEVARRELTDTRMAEVGRSALTLAHRRPVRAEADAFDAAGAVPSVAFFETERGGSFFLTGGLTAVHAASRKRGDVWDALVRRETYGTSGPRILLWFDALLRSGARHPMGSEIRTRQTPRFEVRAAGSFEQKPGCPDHALGALSTERLEWLCRGECYHPSDRRRPITRIEVVRIRPRATPNEDLGSLIEDPWLVLPCDGDAAGCRVLFEDPEFETGGRDVTYYVRAIEAPSPTIGANPLGCSTTPGAATETCASIDPCFERPDEDDCLAPSEHRAWSSPIFVDFG